jgi:UPF0755 protein
VAVGLTVIGWLLLVYPKQPAAGRGRPVRVHIGPDASVGEVARALAEAGAVERPGVFAIYARLMGAEERLRHGELVLMDDLPPGELLPHVADGFGPAWMRVAVPEGFTRFDVAARLHDFGICERHAFLEATGSAGAARAAGVEAPTLEGYLFPATYELAKGSPCAQVARTMVDTWRERVLPLVEAHAGGLAALQQDLGWGLHEAVVLASIVEKEAAVPDERPIIAGVFLNRLRSETFRPQRLQADPTVSYGCRAVPEAPSCGTFEGRITGTMLRDADNPYNTYRVEGLPPGPIANPGIESLRAVLDPAEHAYFYFVARGEGRHHFSETLEAHNAAVHERRRLADR